MSRLLGFALVLVWFVAFAYAKAYIVWFRYDWLRNAARNGDRTLRFFLAVMLGYANPERHEMYLRISSGFECVATTAITVLMVVAGITAVR